MIFLAKLGIGVLGTAVVAGAAISNEGFIQVRVHAKHPGGDNVALIVPAAIVPVALHFVPKQQLDRAPEDLQKIMPVLDAAIPELQKCRDGVLVEVIDPGEHVLISKSGDSLVIDVNDHDETVHVSVPLGAVRASLHQIAEANGTKD